MGRKKQLARESESPSPSPGCNSSIGCRAGSAIAADAVPDGSIRLNCSNRSCPAVPWCHEECVDALEEYLVKEMLRTKKGGARDWEPSLARSNLWRQRGYDLIFRLCPCAHLDCNGHLRRADALPAGQTYAPTQAKKPATKSKPPGPPVPKKENLGRPSKWTASAKFPPPPQDDIDELDAEWLPASSASRIRISHAQSIAQPSKPRQSMSWAQASSQDWGSPASSKANFPDLIGNTAPIKAKAFVRPPDPKTKKEYSDDGTMWEVPLTPQELLRQAFVRTLETELIKAGGELWEGGAEVVALMSSLDPALMVELADKGGIGGWLLLHSEWTRQRRGRLVYGHLKPVPRQREGLGVVMTAESVCGLNPRGTILDQSVGVKVLFNETTDFGLPDAWPTKDDFVKFRAEESAEEIGCKWLILSATIVQSAADSKQALGLTSRITPPPQPSKPAPERHNSVPATSRPFNRTMPMAIATPSATAAFGIGFESKPVAPKPTVKVPPTRKMPLSTSPVSVPKTASALRAAYPEPVFIRHPLNAYIPRAVHIPELEDRGAGEAGLNLAAEYEAARVFDNSQPKTLEEERRWTAEPKTRRQSKKKKTTTAAPSRPLSKGLPLSNSINLSRDAAEEEADIRPPRDDWEATLSNSRPGSKKMNKARTHGNMPMLPPQPQPKTQPPLAARMPTAPGLNYFVPIVEKKETVPPSSSSQRKPNEFSLDAHLQDDLLYTDF